MTRLFRSLSFRLALTYALLFSLSVGLLFGAGYWWRVVRPMADVRATVEAEAGEVARIYRKSGIAAARAALDRRAHTAAARVPFHVLVAPDGEIVVANLPSWPPRPARDLSVIEADKFVDGFEIDHSAFVRDRAMPDGARVIVGRDVQDIVDDEDLLRTGALWMLFGSLALGITGGWLMSQAIGKRIEAVVNTALQVMEGDLSGRVPVRGTRDDFDRLCATLNLMLSRIETLFEAVRRVSDNVAHELRTPLARLAGKLEVLEHDLGEEFRGDPAARQAVAEAIVEANRLRAIFAALIRISRLEGGRATVHLQRTDVVQLLEDVVEFYQPEAERRGIDLVLDARRPLVADLDLDMVFQAMSNLLDNALKHVPDGSRVDVRAGRQGAELLLAVADNGPGLSPADLARVTEPFYRAEGSAGIPGEGLGLSMVAAIAQVHGARVVFSDNRPGLSVVLRFPVRPL
ncbi:signal transduction histidine kinase [Novosphingobium sp. PhB57]|uniref:sensor histidine kinase n=1 Tax=Novosphingobium sp. PhB57 TaxID=2485107 RepID=UPI001052C4B5|nr:HAMP domain-containing sensor histidine kinase [Novosphingobium sp. PhB57]TCU54459.1 signal transduction histidine kinase [Novosphingobium sp. PhB57]